MINSAFARARLALSPLERDQIFARYAIAAIAAVCAVLLRRALDPILGHVAFYATVYMAVAYCALVCGLIPAALSALLGFFGVLYWFVDPRHVLRIVSKPEIHGIMGFFLVSGVLIALGDANRRKRLRLKSTVAQLTAEGIERKRAEEDLQRAHDELERRVEERTADLSEALARLESEVEVRKAAEEEMRRLTLRLMTLQDQERRRIARELHDTTGQTLAALKICLASVERIGADVAGLRPLLDDLNALTDEASSQIRTTSYLLHPPLLDEVGFTVAAQYFVEGFAKRANIELECDVQQAAECLSKDSELVLFRVLQESLTNVHRHSGASAASVKVRVDSNQLHLEVRDNGHGIDKERLRQFREAHADVGVGLPGMRERVRQLGGRFEINSDKTGTTLNVYLPVSNSSPSRAGVGISA
jgi:signal transduction histidine kinase